VAFGCGNYYDNNSRINKGESMKGLFLTAATLLFLMASCSVQPVAEKIPTTMPVVEPTPIPSEPVQEPTSVSTGAETSVITKVFRIVPGESQATYEVGETFLNQQNRFAVAIGMTTEINGEITAVLSNPPASTIGTVTVDISQLTSDSSRRDDAIRKRWLESATFPLAVFSPVKIEGLPDAYVEGEDYKFSVSGDLTVHEVTKPVVFSVTANLQGDSLSGIATSTVRMSDFGIGPISIAGILNTEDDVKLALNFVARP